LTTKAGIDAKVISIEGDTATIAVLSKLEVGAPEVKFEVPLADLENKRYEIDREAEAERRQARLEKAEAVEVADWLIEDGGERYFYSVEDYLEYCEEEELEPNEFLWCGKIVEPNKIDASAFAASLEEQLDINDLKINGLAELQEAIDRFYAANPDTKLIDIDYSRYVVVKQEAMQP
jgi:hypothetical protein